MKLEQFDDIADFGINLLVRWNYDDTFALDDDDDWSLFGATDEL